jgi:hypothetical protein
MKLNEIEVKDTSSFMTFEEGSNKIRIVSDFVARQSDFGTKYCCWVIDRKDGDIKLASFGKMIIKQLQGFQKSEEYSFEDKPNYDIDVQRAGKGMETRYNLVPARTDSPITDDERTLIEKAGSLSEFIQKIDKNKSEVSQNKPLEQGDEGYTDVNSIPF